MTVIDRYISFYPFKSSDDLALEVGVSKHFIERRRQQLELENIQTSPLGYDINNEIQALLNLIEVRGSGWAVDVAKRRLKDIFST